MPDSRRLQNEGLRGWEHFSHDADVGIRGWGSTLAEAFEQAALALVATASPFAQFSFIPLLTLIAFYSPTGHRATRAYGRTAEFGYRGRVGNQSAHGRSPSCQHFDHDAGQKLISSRSHDDVIGATSDVEIISLRSAGLCGV